MAARCSPAPSRLPSLTGTDAERLDEYLPPLPSRARVYQQVLEALNEMERSSDPMIVMLVAEWGDGKTSIYNARIRPWLREHGWAVLEARAATVLEHLRSLEGREEKSPAYRLLAALLAAGLEAAGLLRRYGHPSAAGDLREYVSRVLLDLASERRLLVFVDEMEDIVASADEGRLAELVAGLVGIVNGEVEIVSAGCSGSRCLPGHLHIVVSLTPPAYSRLMGLRDFATVASRLRRRVRTIWIHPLPRREAFAFLESLARYSLGAGLEALLGTPAYANAIVSGTLGNMGALVSAFRYLVSWASGRGGCSGVKALDSGELVEALENLTLSVGGAELPALNPDAYGRLVEGWESRAKLAGLPGEAARRLLDELVVRGLAGEEELAELLGVDEQLLGEMVGELNLYGESGWPSRELGVSRLVHRVKAVAAVEDAFKLLRGVEPEIVKLLPQLAGREDFKPLDTLMDSLVYMDSAGRLVVAVPESREDTVDLVRDASPLELGRSEAERLAGMLWEGVFSKLAAAEGYRALLLSPRMQRMLYVSPELHYLDFLSDRVERLRLLRRAYSEGSRSHLLAGFATLLSLAGIAEQPPEPVGEGVARLELRLPGGARARVMLYAATGEVTGEEAERLEKRLMGLVMSGWRPHLVLLVHHGGVEGRAEDRLAALERKLFIKVARIALPSMVSKIQLMVLGAKLLDAAGGLEEALQLASKLQSVEEQRRLGLDPFKLQGLVQELLSELRPLERVESSLREGVDGVPLIIGDPKLGYDVERPTELSGALRYFLVAPSTRTTAAEALRAAYEYVMRYHLHRGGGEAGRGLLSPDIDAGEVSTLEKYMVLLAANGMLEKLNGSVRVDVLSPAERAVLSALQQAGGYSEEGVPASQIWQNLVVAARNPGTRRMLLQALTYRGLVEVLGGGRRVDPDRSRVRLVDEARARELLEEARRRLEELAGRPEVREWGYIVSAKARGYRAGSLEAFTSKMRSLLGLAEEALRAGELRMALRLVRTVLDAVDYVSEELVAKHVAAAASEARELRARLGEEAGRIRELREALEDSLGRLLGRRVKVRVPVEEKLAEALEAAEKVMALRMGEGELEERVRELWEEARRASPRDPGRRMPFYVQGMGPVYHFNYKYWLLVQELAKRGLVEVDTSGVRVGGELARTVEALERLLGEARRLLEEAAGARRLAEELASKLSRLGRVEVKPEAIMLRGVEAPEELELSDVEQLLQLARDRVEEAKKPLEELDARVSRLLSLVEEVAELERRAMELAEKARETSRRALELGHPLAGRLAEIASDLELAVRQAEAVRGKAMELLSAPGSIAESVENAVKMMESAKLLLSDTLARGERAYREAEEEAARLARTLELEAEAVAEVLRRAGIEPPAKPRTVDPFEAMLTLSKHLRELQELAIAKGVLGEKELKAYSVIAEARRQRGELLMREAVSIVSEKLGLSRSEAKKLIIELIEKEILEPKL